MEQRKEMDNRLWEKIGEHTGRIQSVEHKHHELLQSFTNLRAESHSHIERLEEKIDDYGRKFELFVEELSRRLSKQERFQLATVIGGGVVAAMVLGICSFCGWVIVNYQSIKHFLEV